MGIEDEVGRLTSDYIKQKLNYYEEEIRKVNGAIVPLDELRTLLCEANGWINLLCGNDHQLFDDYRYHLISDGQDFRIIQGHELDTDPGHDDLE